MRVLFLLHDDWYQYTKADLLASLYPIEGIVVIRRKRDWWARYLWKRAKRIGFAKVLDELLFRAWWTVFRARSDARAISKLMKETQDRLPRDYKRPPVYRIENINSDAGRQILRELKPDVCVLMVHPILSKNTFSIPPMGMLVFHPGVTPEYRGPHSAFWAVINNELWGIGWSLLRVDEGIDTGPVLAQASCTSVDPLHDTHIIMQHRSHVDGMPHVAAVLRRMERGEQPRVEMIDRRSTNYTHPGLSDYFRFLRVRAELRRKRGPRGTPKPAGVL